MVCPAERAEFAAKQGHDGTRAHNGSARRQIFADAEAVYTYEGTFEVNTLIAGRDITGVSAIR